MIRMSVRFGSQPNQDEKKIKRFYWLDSATSRAQGKANGRIYLQSCLCKDILLCIIKWNFVSWSSLLIILCNVYFKREMSSCWRWVAKCIENKLVGTGYELKTMLVTVLISIKMFNTHINPYNQSPVLEIVYKQVKYLLGQSLRQKRGSCRYQWLLR